MSSEFFNQCPFGEYKVVHDYGGFVEYEGCRNKLLNSSLVSKNYDFVVSAFRSDPWVYGSLFFVVLIGIILLIIACFMKK